MPRVVNTRYVWHKTKQSFTRRPREPSPQFVSLASGAFDGCFELTSVGEAVALPTGQHMTTMQRRDAPAAANCRAPPHRSLSFCETDLPLQHFVQNPSLRPKPCKVFLLRDKTQQTPLAAVEVSARRVKHRRLMAAPMAGEPVVLAT